MGARKSFVKVKSDSENINKNYLLKSIESVILKKDSLDTFVDDLKCNLCNRKCKYSMKSKIARNVKSVKMMAMIGAKFIKLLKNYQITV